MCVLVPLIEVLWKRYSVKAVEALRVVDQDALALRLVGHPLGQQVREVAVVGHLFARAGMGPVRAPHDTVRGRVYHRPREWDQIRVARERVGDEIRPHQLRPSVVVPQQPEQRLERGGLESTGRWHAAEM